MPDVLGRDYRVEPAALATALAHALTGVAPAGLTCDLLPAVAADVAPLLGWDEAEIARQVAAFEAVVDAELAAETDQALPPGVPAGTRA